MNKTLFFLLAAVIIELTVAKHDKEKAMAIGMKCKTKSGASDEDVQKIMLKEVPESREGKCMVACFLKEIGVMTADGKFDEEGHKMLVEKHFADDQAMKDKINAAMDECRDKVNGVTDDAEGCERAAVMHACCIEKSKKYGIDIEEM